MTKNVLALCGLVALVSGLGIWQFGYFTDVKEQIERETAVTRAQRIVRDMEERAASLTDRARKLRIDARTREKAIEREEADTEKTRDAIKTLASLARKAGLPKPSEATDEDRKKTMPFKGRKLTASEVYKTLEAWQIEVTQNLERLKVPRTMIDRIRTTADQLEEKQSLYVSQVQATRATLEKLEMQRDMAALDAELAELGASVSGKPAGELQGVLETLQKQIDEYESTSEVLLAETGPDEPLTPDEVLSGETIESSVRSEIDALWD